jgi:hypothetical protein
MSLKAPDYFRGYLFDPVVSTVSEYQGGLRVEAKVRYSVGGSINATYCAQWEKAAERSFMLGLLIDAAQTVEVDYLAKDGQWFALTRQTGKGAIVDQLGDCLGTPVGKQWVAFSQPAAAAWALDVSEVANGLVTFDARVAIFPTAGPEFIPFVGRHLNDRASDGSFVPGKFEAGHMPGMWYVPKRLAMADGQIRVYGSRGWQYLK